MPKKTKKITEVDKVSVKFKAKLLKAIEKRGKELGTNMYEAFAEMLYNRSVQSSVRASLFKTLSEMLVVKKTEVDVKDNRKVIVLPNVQNKPEEFKNKENKFNSEMTH